ncbi:erythromycin esterase family protein [Nonomuraea sp. NN258]|uniref:erythromycin esterase family protein n=1 Tax=Nonomuraea antri TaxID=2730852 RepID=UPI001568D71A|nr:erythromycin esterase family protein [Nonomuraea antri]NRQ35484.1 erythromycin esterase family protein [Nonomuraea antri]
MATTSAIIAAARAFHGEDVGPAISGLLGTLRERPRVLGLGEPTHREDALPRLRNELFHHLAEHEGYRSIALESDCLAALTVDAYVTGGEDTSDEDSLDDVMRRGFNHELGEYPANRELVRWMREHNRDLPRERRLRFFGFDAPIEIMGPDSPRTALAGLYGHLAPHVPADLLTCTWAEIDELIGDDARWSDPAAAMDPSRSVGRSAEAVRLRLIADDLAALLQAQTPHLISATSREQWWRAALHARTATGLMRYHASMADPAQARVGRLMGMRDAMMADNLTAVAHAHGPTLAFAHNRHLQRELSRWRLADMDLEWWSAGAIVQERLPGRYAFVATTVGAAPHLKLDVPPPDTLEGLLYGLPDGRHVLDGARLSAALAGTGLNTRTTDNHGYFPLDPAHLPGLDGIVFVKDLDPS